MSINRRSFVVFTILGLISLLADMVYEGARSASGAFLEHLKAPPIASSIIGFGEFMGYSLRFISASIATILGSSFIIWSMIALGYALNVLVLPFLALTTSWEIAVSFFLLERVGKGLRAPLRDAVLAEVTEGIGRGKGFGLHELMDQVGALAGPLLFAYVIAMHGYSTAFLVLIIPGSIVMLLIASAWSMYPRIKSISSTSRRIEIRGFNTKYKLYIYAMVFQSLGFIHWAIVSYFLKHWGVMGDAEIAMLYALAMVIDAIVALPVGYLYDAVKYKSLYIAPVLTMLITPLILTKMTLMAVTGSILWGVVMSVSETIMRASIADIIGKEKLAIAYGVFAMIYGISWSLGGLILVFLIQYSLIGVLTYITITQLASILILRKLNRFE
ncbi:MAG: MFS transporter [Ignisphaera sp.]